VVGESPDRATPTLGESVEEVNESVIVQFVESQTTVRDCCRKLIQKTEKALAS